MAKNSRAKTVGGAHAAGCHKKKPGPKKSAGGKALVAAKEQRRAALKKAAWSKKKEEIIASLKTERGESLTASASRVVLIVTMQLVNDRGIEHSRNAKGIDGAFAEAARLTRVGRETIRSVFYSFVDSGYETYQVSDHTIRGSGSPLVDRQTVRKLTIMQTKAIDAFIEHRNSSSAAGKVTLDEISKYMQEGPGEDASAPALSEDLRVRIPRSSLRYVLIHCLGYRHGYTKKKVVFKEPKKRHLRVRRFIIEMDRALKLQDGTYISGKFEVRGNYVIVNKPEVLDSKVEKTFREKGWKIIWTPPYSPKYQPIELVWGVGKQRAGTLYMAGRNLELTREHLRRGWYGGKGSGNKVFEPCNVRGCWETALVEMNKWLAVDKACNDGTDGGKIGVSGKMGNLIGSEAWTATGTDDLNISDMGDDGDYDWALPQTADGLAAEEEEDLEIVQVAAGHLGGLD